MATKSASKVPSVGTSNRKSLLPPPKSFRQPTRSNNINNNNVKDNQKVFTNGDLVLISGVKCGTVQYFGKTHFGEGLWCGVELDDNEGRHDGIVDGVRYFHCQLGHGIFAPVSKVEHTTVLDSLSSKTEAIPLVEEDLKPKPKSVKRRSGIPGVHTKKSSIPAAPARQSSTHAKPSVVPSVQVKQTGSVQSKETGLKRGKSSINAKYELDEDKVDLNKTFELKSSPSSGKFSADRPVQGSKLKKPSSLPISSKESGAEKTRKRLSGIPKPGDHSKPKTSKLNSTFNASEAQEELDTNQDDCTVHTPSRVDSRTALTLVYDLDTSGSSEESPRLKSNNLKKIPSRRKPGSTSSPAVQEPEYPPTLFSPTLTVPGEGMSEPEDDSDPMACSIISTASSMGILSDLVLRDNELLDEDLTSADTFSSTTETKDITELMEKELDSEMADTCTPNDLTSSTISADTSINEGVFTQPDSEAGEKLATPDSLVSADNSPEDGKKILVKRVRRNTYNKDEEECMLTSTPRTEGGEEEEDFDSQCCEQGMMEAERMNNESFELAKTAVAQYAELVRGAEEEQSRSRTNSLSCNSSRTTSECTDESKLFTDNTMECTDDNAMDTSAGANAIALDTEAALEAAEEQDQLMMDLQALHRKAERPVSMLSTCSGDTGIVADLPNMPPLTSPLKRDRPLSMISVGSADTGCPPDLETDQLTPTTSSSGSPESINSSLKQDILDSVMDDIATPVPALTLSEISGKNELDVSELSTPVTKSETSEDSLNESSNASHFNRTVIEEDAISTDSIDLLESSPLAGKTDLSSALCETITHLDDFNTDAANSICDKSFESEKGILEMSERLEREMNDSNINEKPSQLKNQLTHVIEDVCKDVITDDDSNKISALKDVKEITTDDVNKAVDLNTMKEESVLNKTLDSSFSSTNEESILSTSSKSSVLDPNDIMTTLVKGTDSLPVSEVEIVSAPLSVESSAHSSIHMSESTCKDAGREKQGGETKGTEASTQGMEVRDSTTTDVPSNNVIKGDTLQGDITLEEKTAGSTVDDADGNTASSASTTTKDTVEEPMVVENQPETKQSKSTSKKTIKTTSKSSAPAANTNKPVKSKLSSTPRRNGTGTPPVTSKLNTGTTNKMDKNSTAKKKIEPKKPLVGASKPTRRASAPSVPVGKLDLNSSGRSVISDIEEEEAGATKTKKVVKRALPKPASSNDAAKTPSKQFKTEEKRMTARKSSLASGTVKKEPSATSARRGSLPRPVPSSGRLSLSSSSAASKLDSSTGSNTSLSSARGRVPRTPAKPTNRTTSTLKGKPTPSSSSESLASRGTKRTTTRESTPEKMKLGATAAKRSSVPSIQIASSRMTVEQRRASLAAGKVQNKTGKDTPRKTGVKKTDITRTKSSTTKPSQQPEAVSNAANKDSAKITELKALCAARSQELDLAKKQIATNAQGFDALGIMVRYLTEELNAFSCPEISAELQSVTKKWQETQNQISALKLEHDKEMQTLTSMLRQEAEMEVQSIIDKHSHEVKTLNSFHERKVSDMKKDHEEDLFEKNLQHKEDVDKVYRENEEKLIDIQKQHDAKLQDITMRFEHIKLSLSEKVEYLRGECEEMRRREKMYLEEFQRDSDAKVRQALEPYKQLPNEIESLRTVLEMKTLEMHDLRSKKMDLEKRLEDLPKALDRIKQLEQKNENLEAVVNIKTDYEKQLAEKQGRLMRKLERESKAMKRLSMDNEELMYRLDTMSMSFPNNSPDSTMMSGSFHRQISHSPPRGSSSESSAHHIQSPRGAHTPRSPRVLHASNRSAQNGNHFFPESPNTTLKEEESPTNLKRSGTYELLNKDVDNEEDLMQNNA